MSQKIVKTIGDGTSTFRLPREGTIDLVFTGKLVVKLEDLELDESEPYVGAITDRAEMSLYQTLDGRYVLVRQDGFPYQVETAKALLEALENGGELRGLEKMLLDEAAELDDAIAKVAVEHC
jgi:hypothetical protein